MAQYREGQTATRADGSKLVYQGGMWRSMGGDRQLATQDRDRLGDARSAAQNATDVLGDLTRFQDLNAAQPTGGPVNAWNNFFDRLGGDTELQQLDEISSRLAPQQRPVGSGTTSDMDLKLYLNATPGAGKSTATNNAIIERGRAEAVRRQQYADFLDQYAQRNGTLNGAEAAFRSMIGLGTEQNPYTSEQAGDRSRLPRGAYYDSPEGLRRNDNGSRGNPVTKPRRRTRPQRESLDSIFGG